MAELEMSETLEHIDFWPKIIDGSGSLNESNEMNNDNEDFVIFYNHTKYVEEGTNDTIFNDSIGSANDTTVNDAQPLCSTDISVACIRYYVEGVLLVPLCFFGVFGK